MNSTFAPQIADGVVAHAALLKAQGVTLSDGTDAAFWAVYVYLPRHYFEFTIAFVTLIVPLWEHVAGIQNEVRVWRRVIKRHRKAPRLLLPMAISILLLRYLTLAFIIAWACVYGGHNWSTAQCSKLWPICIVCTTALCWCTSVVLTIRAALYFPTAIQSRRILIVLRALLSLFLALHLVAFLTTWALTGDILNLSLSINGTCANGTVGRYGSNHQTDMASILQSRSLLLLNFGCSLMLDCIITIFACWVFRRIRRQGSRTASLVSIFLANTIQYFIAVVACAIFGIVWFVKKDPSIGVLNLYTAIAAVLAIRMLSAEFAFTDNGASRHAAREDDPSPDNGDFEAEVVVGAGKGEMMGVRQAYQQQPYIVDQHVDFRRGGLTDIEALSALPFGRSLERPEPVWLDDLTPANREREVSSRGITSVVTRDTLARQIKTS
ncbi:hypothetical protein A4X13_0g1573 [Tilletia indica]|uniref:Uncharacterized protein n=1 Tax=Tilletia indica TaxID=43049 RepID=A0A177TKC5_9BASI|nr:hypothetical protein A4X13_0g1573 [Tilletia indica]